MLQINDLTVRVAGRVLIDNASVSLPPNARVGFLGRNGTGKSTLFKVIQGDLAADAGTIKLPARARMETSTQERDDAGEPTASPAMPEAAGRPSRTIASAP